MLVAIVGASVEPYVRLTTAPSVADASSTNATLTPAPPDEISRNVATRSGAKPGARMSDTKKVGGPTMNVTCSRSIRSSASSGSQRAMNTVRNGTTPGSVTPLSSPEMCAPGAGISTQSSGCNACTSAISAALYESVACVCSTPFGSPLEPEVKSTAASCSASDHSSVTGGPSGNAARSSTTSLGATARRARPTSCGPS